MIKLITDEVIVLLDEMFELNYGDIVFGKVYDAYTVKNYEKTRKNMIARIKKITDLRKL